MITLTKEQALALLKKSIADMTAEERRLLPAAIKIVSTLPVSG